MMELGSEEIRLKHVTCNKCNATFSESRNLRRHVLLKHSPPAELTCAHCSRSFPIKRYLVRHMKCHFPSLNLKCKTCDKSFSRNRYLILHEKNVHSSSRTLYTCAHCSHQCSTKWSLARHMKIHFSLPGKMTKKEKCPLCEYNADKENIIQHFRDVHDIMLSQEILSFDNFGSFESWKNYIERNEKCCFVAKAITRRKDDSYRKLYICHRSGYFKSKGNQKRHLKVMGSNKINGFCPAKLVVEKSTSGLTVQYDKTHVGHSAEIGRQPLSQNDRDVIAQKIALRIPFGCILDDIRDSLSQEKFSRVHLLTKKDLFNIEQCYNLNTDGKRHKNDFVSVESWISEMKNSSNAVRFYKCQGEFSAEYPELNPDDFLLILANDAQLECLKGYGDDCVCIDETHGLNSYGFNLTTLVVLDDLRQGFPGAFLFSNKSDERIMTVFFKIIKNSLNSSVSPTVFMSDMAPSFYNAWRNVMPEPKMRLFCTWHVDRAWRKNLSKIRGAEKQAQIYKLLRTLLEETDEMTFQSLIGKAIESMKSDPDIEKFSEYFEEYYSMNTACWAYCYRRHAGLNTNMHLERLHKTIKYIYLAGKKIKRLDKTLCALMKFVRDKLYDRLITINKGKVTSKISHLRRRHAASVKIALPIPKDDDTWIISSSTSSPTVYEIRRNNTACECLLKCSDCDFCMHAFFCSCHDNAIKWDMCKHIHALGRHLKGTFHQPVPPISFEAPSCSVFPGSSAMVIDENDAEQQSIALVGHLKEQSPITQSNTFENSKSKIVDQFMALLDKAKTNDHLKLISKGLTSVSATIDAEPGLPHAEPRLHHI